MTYELWDVDTGNRIAEAETLEELTEVKAELRDSGAPTDDLQILQLEEGQPYTLVVE